MLDHEREDERRDQRQHVVERVDRAGLGGGLLGLPRNAPDDHADHGGDREGPEPDLDVRVAEVPHRGLYARTVERIGDIDLHPGLLVARDGAVEACTSPGFRSASSAASCPASISGVFSFDAVALDREIVLDLALVGDLRTVYVPGRERVPALQSRSRTPSRSTRTVFPPPSPCTAPVGFSPSSSAAFSAAFSAASSRGCSTSVVASSATAPASTRTAACRPSSRGRRPGCGREVLAGEADRATARRAEHDHAIART